MDLSRLTPMVARQTELAERGNLELRVPDRIRTELESCQPGLRANVSGVAGRGHSRIPPRPVRLVPFEADMNDRGGNRPARSFGLWVER
jgi:hypothetical protein